MDNVVKRARSMSAPVLNERPEMTKQIKKAAHNVIEKRYRNNINNRIAELRQVIPALSALNLGSHGGSDVPIDGVTPVSKLNKATILRKAREYIEYLKSTNEELLEQNMRLNKIIESFGVPPQWQGGD
jgi:hypothetical protein